MFLISSQITSSQLPNLHGASVCLCVCFSLSLQAHFSFSFDFLSLFFTYCSHHTLFASSFFWLLPFSLRRFSYLFSYSHLSLSILASCPIVFHLFFSLFHLVQSQKYCFKTLFSRGLQPSFASSFSFYLQLPLISFPLFLFRFFFRLPTIILFLFRSFSVLLSHYSLFVLASPPLPQPLSFFCLFSHQHC
jgi:hypothetical protein